MRKGRRRIMVAVLVLIGLGAATLGWFGLPSSSSASQHITERVRRGNVAVTVSASGTVVDEFTYVIAPKTDPVLTERAGEKVNQAISAQGYETTKLWVLVGDKVKAKAKLAVVKDANDKKSTVKTPFAGRVRAISTTKGSSAGQVATIGAGKTLVSVKVNEYDLPRLKVNQKVSLTLSASKARFSGTVLSLGQTADSTSGVQQYQVLIKTDNLPAAARVGMSVTATISIQSRIGVLTVPASAVSHTGRQAEVQTVDAKGALVTTKVQLGLVGDGRVQVVKGLHEDDRVVVGASGSIPSTSNAGFGPPTPAQ